MKKTTIVAALALPLLALTAACGETAHSDAPDVQCTDAQGKSTGLCIVGTKARVLKNPDGFRNIYFQCFGPNGVYTTSRGATGSAAEGTASSVFVVPNDTQCQG